MIMVVRKHISVDAAAAASLLAGECGAPAGSIGAIPTPFDHQTAFYGTNGRAMDSH
jgi:hypothetical protein